MLSLGLLVLVFVAGGILAQRVLRTSGGHERSANPSTADVRPLSKVYPLGWTKLPPPPEIRDGAAYVWIGSDLLAWGGCDPSGASDCVKTADGFAFDPWTRTWRTIPKAPLPGAYTDVVWTGEEAIFLGLKDQGRLDGEAYDPASGSWREIASAPVRHKWRSSVLVWTGSELIVWGGGHPGTRGPERGAAYDPATDMWRSIADAPHGLNLASGMWTGRDVLVFGSLLNGKNRADTRHSVGASYDPVADTWHELPPSALSPQATSAVWVDHRMVAWDYEVHSQEYHPRQNRWTAPIKMPIGASECYPDSVLVRALVLASFCGQDALYDAPSATWQQIHGGPLDAKVWSDAYHSYIKLWRFGELVSAGNVAFVAAEGITLTHKGEACYGCPGSPHSFWAYRPPAHVVTVPH